MIKYDDKLPKYCRQCGSLMKQGSHKLATNGIDSMTGKPNGREQYRLYCSKRFKLFGFHDDFLVIDSPHGAILNRPHRTILTMMG